MTTTSASRTAASKRNSACGCATRATRTASRRCSVQQRRDRPGEEREVALGREAMIAVLDQRDLHVTAREALGEGEAGLPGHVGILHAVQQPHRAGDRDGPAHEEMPPAVLDQFSREE